MGLYRFEFPHSNQYLVNQASYQAVQVPLEDLPKYDGIIPDSAVGHVRAAPRVAMLAGLPV